MLDSILVKMVLCVVLQPLPLPLSISALVSAYPLTFDMAHFLLVCLFSLPLHPSFPPPPFALSPFTVHSRIDSNDLCVVTWYSFLFLNSYSRDLTVELFQGTLMFIPVCDLWYTEL